MEEFEVTDRQRFESTLKLSGWVECQCCRAIMYDSYNVCWSCGSAMDGPNALPVSL